MLHGPQKEKMDVRLELPSACADSVADSSADVGIIPVFEMDRHKLPHVPGIGIASNGPVRSIFLLSRRPAESIQSIAMDSSSRTSVVLARIILGKKYSNRPTVVSHEPNLEAMLKIADAALIIGDPALRIDPADNKFHVGDLNIYDLGQEWTEMTGLPMVYALWAGRKASEAAQLLQDSYEYGRERIEDIVKREAKPRGFSIDLARTYLTKNIIFELGAEHERGLALYLKLAKEY